MTRHEARTQAFLLLFEQSLNHSMVDQLIDMAEEAGSLMPEDTSPDTPPKPVDDFAVRLATGVEAHREELDAIISRYARGWSLRRLSKVCLALLRIALFEMRYADDIPVSVSINEAVELAKTYGGADDAPFINGILGTAAKELASNG